MSNVSGIIKSIQDIMRKDVGVDGDAQRISQLVWMFFLKIYDDREAEIELLEDNYKSPLPKHLRWRNWAADPEGMTGDELGDFVNLQLFPTLKNKLAVSGPTGERAKVIRNVFEDAYNYMKSGTLMRQVINKICEINFNNTQDRHTFGSIYEQILKDLQSAGNAGEFYTPRAVTKFIVDRVDPKLAESVLDPACGTGGFLACAIDHKRNRYVKNAADEAVLVTSIHGVEKKALPHMLCTTNMILHGIDTPTQIEHDNMLSRRAYTDYGEADRVNVIITNPPFGGMEEDGVENQFPATLRTRETADLFMALVVRLLKSHGRAAVVLPDGFLFGEGMKTRLKQTLLEQCHLHTIVRLPNGVFNPYTGIKTNILFFTKKPEAEWPATQEVWFYEHPYPEGVTSYNKTRPMQFEEFASECAWWGDEADGFAARVETPQAWKVSREDIAARNYNLDIKNPHVGEQISHNPEALLQQYEAQQQEIQSLRDQLKSILAAALDRQIATLYYERLLSRQDKAALQQEASNLIAAQTPADPRDFIRDPYILEFIGAQPGATLFESELETGLIQQLQAFLLELGKGFAFVARQKHLRVENEDCFIDLVFYNYLLKCFVLIDLKIGKLAHQDVGQMDMYVRVFEEQYRAEGDNPTLGLILCSERNEAVAKYSLLAGSQQLFASRYRPFLPSEAELQAELQRDRALLENQREAQP